MARVKFQRRSTTRRSVKTPTFKRFTQRKTAYRYKRPVVRRKAKPVGGPRFVMFNSIVQEKIRTKLRYCDTKTLTPGAGKAEHLFRLNGLSDPDYTGVGHQPAFFDNWAALYASYRVLGVRWKLVFQPHRGDLRDTYAGTADTYPYSDTSSYNQTRLPLILFYEANDDGVSKFTEAADLNVLREIGSKMGNVGYKLTGPSPNKSYVLQGKASIRNLLDDPAKFNLATTVSGLPSDTAFLHVGCMSKDGGTSATYRVDITLDFIVEFSDVLDVDEN